MGSNGKRRKKPPDTSYEDLRQVLESARASGSEPYPMTVGRLFGRRSLYEFKYPWRSEPSMKRMASNLEKRCLQDAKLDYSTLPTSTFILARKTRDAV